MQVLKTFNKRDSDAFRKAAAEPEWKQALRDGSVLVVDKRPNWSVHEDTMLRSRKVEEGIAIWLENKEHPPYEETHITTASDPMAPRTKPLGTEEPPVPQYEEPDLTQEAAAIFMNDGEE